MHPYFLVAALMQIPAATSTIPLLADCSPDAEVVTRFTPSADPITVRTSRAEGGPVCYSLAVRVGTQIVLGYVLGNPGIRAIAEFDTERVIPPTPARAKLAPSPSHPPDPVLLSAPKFPNFTAVDTKNRRVALDGFDAKYLLVIFWSPRNAQSARELILVTRLHERFRGAGLEVLGVSLDLDRVEIVGALEDFGASFPNISDNIGLAGRVRLSSNQIPYTFILNREHEIVASGLHNQRLEAAVKEFMLTK